MDFAVRQPFSRLPFPVSAVRKVPWNFSCEHKREDSIACKSALDCESINQTVNQLIRRMENVTHKCIALQSIVDVLLLDACNNMQKNGNNKAG